MCSGLCSCAFLRLYIPLTHALLPAPLFPHRARAIRCGGRLATLKARPARISAVRQTTSALIVRTVPTAVRAPAPTSASIP
jgi:hypothetical protein